MNAGRRAFPLRQEASEDRSARNDEVEQAFLTRTRDSLRFIEAEQVYSNKLLQKYGVDAAAWLIDVR